MSQQHDFSDIAPFGPDEFSGKMLSLTKEPGFEHAVRYVMPDADYPQFAEQLVGISDQDTFQSKIMWPFLEMLANKTTSGITVSGLEAIRPEDPHTFVTNHRDIVLDASFLNLCFLRNGYPTSEVAIGNNLLVYDWIDDLVRLNKSFIVKRNLKLTKALEAARQLSAYIHYAITCKRQSVWIAQREGRAKDSNDMTQESVVKMLGLEGGGSLLDNIMALNIVPVSISYEWDPNDGLKAKEMLLKRRDPEFKKSQHDDLLSMETGLLQPKGHIHFAIGTGINERLAQLPANITKLDLVKAICHIIDRSIHEAYHLYPVNYVAQDLLTGSDEYASHYTPADVETLEKRVAAIPAKTGLVDLTPDEEAFIRKVVLEMYANPLRNKIKAQSECDSPC